MPMRIESGSRIGESIRLTPGANILFYMGSRCGSGEFDKLVLIGRCGNAGHGADF